MTHVFHGGTFEAAQQDIDNGFFLYQGADGTIGQHKIRAVVVGEESHLYCTESSIDTLERVVDFCHEAIQKDKVDYEASKTSRELVIEGLRREVGKLTGKVKDARYESFSFFVVGLGLGAITHWAWRYFL